jgi:Family of unknown function (DUF6464)
MLIAVLIIFIGIAWPILATWLSLRPNRRLYQRFEPISSPMLDAMVDERLRLWLNRDPDEHYVDGMGFVIGDITCELNAHSPLLRCAVNPQGPCAGCRDYQAKPMASEFQES